VSLGPAIGPQAFEVGGDVFAAFVTKNRLNDSAFVATTKGRYLCDIYQLARIELQALGINKIAGENYCTYNEDQRFYSYRRQQTTGRMASLIWLS
jgi:copper oxidase (laccase) domain-containing protein